MNSPQKIWNTQKANKYKNWIIIALVILSLFFIFIRPKPPVPVNVDGTPILEEVRRLEDRNNKMNAVVNQLALSNAQAKMYADSIAQALRLKPKFIKGMDQFIYKHDTVIQVDTVYQPLKGSDTTFYMKHKDAYITLEAKSIAGRQSFGLSSVDTLTRTEVVKSGLFRRTERQTIIRNANPYNEVQRGYSWTIKEPITIVTIGPHVGWDILNNKPTVGVSVQLPLIKIKKK